VTAPPVAPVSVSPPALSGTALPGDTLRCSPGSWTNATDAFGYQWERDGEPIAGATAPTYAVQIADEAHTLSCVVTAHGSGGAIATRAGGGALVAVKGTLGCPRPSGSVSGSRIGPLALGQTRARAHEVLKRFSPTNNGFDNFCLYAGWGIRAGYPTARLLSSLPPSTRRAVRGRIVIALTANPFYALDGARPGQRLAEVSKRLKPGKVFRIGANDWYVVAGRSAAGVVKVRGGVIQEVGLASRRLTRTRAAQSRLLKSFKAG
jgi:hypothetical protein